MVEHIGRGCRLEFKVYIYGMTLVRPDFAFVAIEAEALLVVCFDNLYKVSKAKGGLSRLFDAFNELAHISPSVAIQTDADRFWLMAQRPG